MARERLDKVLASLFSEYSRSRLSQWILQGKVLLDGEIPKPKDRVSGDEQVEVVVEEQAQGRECQPQPIPLAIVYEDQDLLVINKPAGLVVHPAAGHADGTLQNALLYHDEKLVNVPRAGIVHRLDKDTSGLLVVARNLTAHKSLIEQLQERSVHREYLALVNGVLTAGGTIDESIGRSGRDRKRMAVRESGKQAITHYRVEQRYRAHTLVKVNLETGRTHQIRVHMAYIHHNLVGDPLYGGRLRYPKGSTEPLKQALHDFPRQALHAGRLGLIHPRSGEPVEWTAELPKDMQQLLQVLEQDAAA